MVKLSGLYYLVWLDRTVNFEVLPTNEHSDVGGENVKCLFDGGGRSASRHMMRLVLVRVVGRWVKQPPSWMDACDALESVSDIS